MGNDANSKIRQADIENLSIIHYPDPRLSEVSTPVDEVNDSLHALAERMFELMFAAAGVGLAAPQVGVTVRMFVASPTFDAGDRRVYINPEIVSAEGAQVCEEGCLSLPGITIKVKRADSVTIVATDLDGNEFTEMLDDLGARVMLHETDHLDGTLLINRMGSVAKLANRKTIKELEEEFAAAQE